MSKMSQLHAELTEQAIEMGYESLDHFVECGGEVDMVHRKLVRSADELEQAHEAWLKERDELLERLEKKRDKLKKMLCDDTGLYALIADTIEFIKKGEM